jgi:hypothetical protein
MNEETKQILIYTVSALLLVLVSGLVADTLLPDTGIGDAGRFATPLLTGVLAGLYIHMRFREILDVEHHFS